MNLGPHDFAELANTLKSVRPDDVNDLEETAELKACGANKPGGGGFSAGNTCARGGGGSGKLSYNESYKDASKYRKWILQEYGMVMLYGATSSPGAGMNPVDKARRHIGRLAKMTGQPKTELWASIRKDALKLP